MALLHSRGFLEVSTLPRDRIVVSYAGNMGHRLAEVQEVFDRSFGKGSFSRVITAADYQSGSPDYSWCAVLSQAAFDLAVSPAVVA